MFPSFKTSETKRCCAGWGWHDLAGITCTRTKTSAMLSPPQKPSWQLQTPFISEGSPSSPRQALPTEQLSFDAGRRKASTDPLHPLTNDPLALVARWHCPYSSSLSSDRCVYSRGAFRLAAPSAPTPRAYPASKAVTAISPKDSQSKRTPAPCRPGQNTSCCRGETNEEQCVEEPRGMSSCC